MSDLTRRVLEAHQFIEDDTPPVDWNKFDDARAILENSAPILARQVEAVEELADRLDRLARERDEAGDFCLAGAVGTDAARIRAALNSAEKAD